MRGAGRWIQDAPRDGSWQSEPQTETLFGRFRGRFAGLLALVPVVLALELFDPAGGVDVFHLAGEKGMTSRANLDRDVLFRAAGDELVAAAASYGGFDVFRMNAGLH